MIIYLFKILSMVFASSLVSFLKNLSQMSHNVPAVYGVLPARIRALRSKDQGWQNVAEFGVGMKRSGMT
jgi:hypothetical protein